MNQIVRTVDEHGKQLFQWNPTTKTISLVSGKLIWTAKLGDDNKFKVISSFVKPSKVA